MVCPHQDTRFFIFFNPGLMDCPFLPPPAQIASAGQLNKIKQTNGIPQSLSPLTVESWCKHQWKTVPHEYTELPSATTKSSGNNAANPEPQNNHLPTLWPEEKQVAYKKQWPHGSVSCGPRSRRVTPVSILTGRKKTQFSHLRSSVRP